MATIFSDSKRIFYDAGHFVKTAAAVGALVVWCTHLDRAVLSKTVHCNVHFVETTAANHASSSEDCFMPD